MVAGSWWFVCFVRGFGFGFFFIDIGCDGERLVDLVLAFGIGFWVIGCGDGFWLVSLMWVVVVAVCCPL